MPRHIPICPLHVGFRGWLSKALKRLGQGDHRQLENQRDVSFPDCFWKSLKLWKKLDRHVRTFENFRFCEIQVVQCAMIGRMTRTGGYQPLLTTITVHYSLAIVGGTLIA
jgi:hypothetical protein